MKNLRFFQNLLILWTLFFTSFGSSAGVYKANENIPVQAGTEVSFRDWKGDYVSEKMGPSYSSQNMHRQAYLRMCSDVATFGAVCERFYRDSGLYRSVFVSEAGTCVESASGQSPVCIGDLVKPAGSSLTARVVGVGSAAHFNPQNGVYGRYLLIQDLEEPAASYYDVVSLSELWLVSK